MKPFMSGARVTMPGTVAHWPSVDLGFFLHVGRQKPNYHLSHRFLLYPPIPAPCILTGHCPPCDLSPSGSEQEAVRLRPVVLLVLHLEHKRAKT